MKIHSFLIFLLIHAAAAAGFAQNVQNQPKESLDPLKPSQQDLIERLASQERRLQELERQLGQSSPAAKPDAAGEGMRWKDFLAAASRLRVYGFIRLDAIYDDSRPSNPYTTAFIRSEDPAAPASIGNREGRDDFIIHPRLTRIGIDIDGPAIGLLGDAKSSGKLEIDFYNNSLLGQSESRQAVRLRHGYLKLTWDDLFFLGGQTSDVIAPIWPIVNADMVMWGAGNLGDRRPQLRVEYTPAVGSGRFIAQGEIGLSGADDNSDLDAPGAFGAGFRDGETSGRPTLQGRLAYRQPLWEKSNLEGGVWGHLAWERTDTRFNGENDFESNAAGLDLTVPIYQSRLWVKGEIWVGKNVDDVRGGIFQGINTARGEEIDSRGGWVELGVAPLSWYALHFGYSTDDPENGDLATGGRAANQIWYVANRFNFDPIEIGLDYFYWRTLYIGFDKGDDHRFQSYIAFKF